MTACDEHKDAHGDVRESNAGADAAGTEEPQAEEASVASSQLLSGPTLSTPRGSPGSYQDERSLGLSAETSVSNDESYFILDEGGRHVLDNQGSPARARKWKPTNVNQRERYARLHLATKGPAATCRWLQSVLVSPHHLKVPQAMATYGNNTIKGAIVGASSVTTAPGDTAQLIGGSAAVQDVIGADRRREVEVAKRRRIFLAEERRRKRPKQLNGFMLMDACGCELPDDGRKADVSGRGLIGVVHEDLSYFVRLQVVDAGDNGLPFESFANLPRLEELLIPCNNIRDIGTLGSRSYGELRRLDLSYNNLSEQALSMLAKLPSLVDLDLTCNGLTTLPPAMGDLLQLQRLSLERNQLESERVFDVLSIIPRLREVNLAFNYFTAVNIMPEMLQHSFPLLESLNLGFNYIGREKDVESLVLLDRLQRIILYGNPLAGPTGEDPLGLCVENIIDKADRVRDGGASTPLEVITEMPRQRKNHGGRGGGGGRRRPYSDIGVTMVDDGCVPSASAFREAGNKTRFRSERTSSDDPSSSSKGIVESTLRAARERCARRRQPGSQQQRTSTTAAEHRDTDHTFLTGVDRHDVDDVGEYGEHGDSSSFLAEQDTKNDVERLAVLGGGTTAGGGAGLGRMSTRLLRRPVDTVVRGDPVKLRMALSALRYTLKHPVTSSMDVEDQCGKVAGRRGGGTTHFTNKDAGIGRKTAAARARQLPRRPYQLLKAQHDQGLGSNVGLGATGSDSLGTIDHVLTSMGVGIDDMVLEKRVAEKRQGQEVGGGGRPPGLSSIIRTVNAVLDENEY